MAKISDMTAYFRCSLDYEPNNIYLWYRSNEIYEEAYNRYATNDITKNMYFFIPLKVVFSEELIYIFAAFRQ